MQCKVNKVEERDLIYMSHSGSKGGSAGHDDYNVRKIQKQIENTMQLNPKSGNHTLNIGCENL
jgi:hypothetical protein